MSTRAYDSTVARIAGNIVSGLVNNPQSNSPHDSRNHEDFAKISVSLARAIVAETIRTEPKRVADPQEGQGPSLT